MFGLFKDFHHSSDSHHHHNTTKPIPEIENEKVKVLVKTKTEAIPENTIMRVKPCTDKAGKTAGNNIRKKGKKFATK
ncbi:hypothetical protein GGH99_004219, partial [Coemansia sp. RSA 1285]